MIVNFCSYTGIFAPTENFVPTETFVPTSLQEMYCVKLSCFFFIIVIYFLGTPFKGLIFYKAFLWVGWEHPVS